MQSQRCGDDLRWAAMSACLAEGECVPSAVETRTTTRCATEQRICMGGCVWGDWTQTIPSTGECAAGSGETCPDGSLRSRTCDETCHWTECA